MMGNDAELMEPMWLPLGVTADGATIWPICGSEPADDEDEDEDEDDDSDSDDDASDDGEDDEDTDHDGDGEDEDESKKDKSKSDDDDDSEDLAYWKDRADRLNRRVKAADRRANEAERKLRRLERSGNKQAGLSEEDKEDLKEAKQAVAAKDETIQDLRLKVALLSDNSIEWHDPTLVLKSLAEDDTVEIDEDGKVVGVKQALRRLAKDKPYLVKSKSADSDKSGDEDKKRKPSGGSSNGRRRSPTVPDRKKLEQQYPVLTRRR